MLAVQHTNPGGFICNGVGCGRLQEAPLGNGQSDTPWGLLGVIGIILLGGAALMYRNAKRKGE